MQNLYDSRGASITPQRLNRKYNTTTSWVLNRNSKKNGSLFLSGKRSRFPTVACRLKSILVLWTEFWTDC